MGSPAGDGGVCLAGVLRCGADFLARRRHRRMAGFLMPTRVAWSPADWARLDAEQLALFEPKGPKGRRPARGKPKPAPERSTHIALADMLRLRACPDIFWTHIPAGEHRSDKTGALLKRMGLKPGLPDFVFIDRHGHHRYLELKRGRLGKLSLAQELFGSLMLERGVPYAVVRSFAEAEAVLREWGMLR